ncbi:ephrin type-A receptor 4-like isoform X2 [Liolophura sinensis]|uniref:ephrin type-A receptor 4-like isoform X2 n=1 Tax=Liolophura sinensis TaxID=3198878 RepID=UPI0031580349
MGWVEASYNDNEGNPLRIYTSCYVTQTNVNNWLRTPFIDRKDANRLYIDIRFSMRKCIRHKDPQRLQQCKETFVLYYYEAESDFANAMMPTWDPETYFKMDVIAADYLYEDENDIRINVETKSIPITRQGVYFAIQDTGACISLISIKVYYITCPNITQNYALFLETPTGPDLTSVVQKQGQCVANAAEEKRPTYLCKGGGTWALLDGGCKCMPGYQATPSQTCVGCPAGTYKWHTSNEPCRNCPAHSFSSHRHSVMCECESGFYRSPDDLKSAPCTKPPSAPLNLKLKSSDHMSATMTWSQPQFLGGRTDLSYRVECLECGTGGGSPCRECSSGVEFYPKQQAFNTTSLTVRGLLPSTDYNIKVYAENGVTQKSKRVSVAQTEFTTEAAVPAKINDVQVISVGSTWITVGWDRPLGSQGDIERYQLRHFPKNNRSGGDLVYTKQKNYTFRGLALQTEYGFQVRGKTQKGWGQYSDIIYVKTVSRSTIEQGQGMSVGIIAGAIVAVILCMAIAIIMVLILLRRNRNGCNEKNVSECDNLQYTNVVHCAPLEHHFNGGLTVPLFQPPGVVKTYIDPHTYEDPNQAVREFTREIDASHITIESVIGGGEFGDVCKGKLRIPNRAEMSVAIKTLKPGATDKNRLDFLTEASIMGQFDDQNVIFLEGVVTKSNPIMIVTEYMANGSLDAYLRNNDGKFTVIQLVGMMRGIASGMKYLSEMGYVHRDLAARNILVNETLVCKVADFGLSREIESDTTDGAYTTKGGKIPVRWTAPEAIAFRKFTSASDVWSYGVVMWEVMSYGERPYWNWSNQDVIKAVERGYRLPPPMDCPEACHQLMLDCWQKERSHRPKFLAIVKTLDKLIRAPELLRKIAKQRPHNFIDPNMPDMTQFTSIEDWLISIKMERYSNNFLHAGYCNMEQISRMTVKELINLGITLVGHQKKIMNSVQTLRAQLGGVQMSEGFLV